MEGQAISHMGFQVEPADDPQGEGDQEEATDQLAEIDLSGEIADHRHRHQRAEPRVATAIPLCRAV